MVACVTATSSIWRAEGCGCRGVRCRAVPAAVAWRGEDDGDRRCGRCWGSCICAVWSPARWPTRCRRRRRGGCRGCRARLSLSSCRRCWGRATAERRGRRDYAVLVMLARLGLRAGEVAALRFEDVDWRAGELRSSGKGRRIGAAAAARPMSARRSSPTCRPVGRRPRRTARCSCASAPAPWPDDGRGDAGRGVAAAPAPGSARSTRTGCATPPRRRC